MKRCENLTKMSITFDGEAQNSISSFFFMDLIETFRMIFVSFRSSPNSAIVFGNHVICNCWAFKLAYFVEHNELSALKASLMIAR